MKNKLMHFVIIIVIVMIHTIIANNPADFAKLLHLKNQISQEMMRLNLTEKEKEPIVRFFEEKQKKSLQKFLDGQIKPNLDPISIIIKKGLVLEKRDFLNDPNVEHHLKNISTNVDRREVALFLCDFGKNVISHYEQCILNENNSLDFCATCNAMLLLLNADYAVKEIERDIIKQIETNV